MSETKIVKRSGPKIDPCGTQFNNSIQEESPLSVVTCCERLDKYELIHFKEEFLKPKAFSLARISL